MNYYEWWQLRKSILKESSKKSLDESLKEVDDVIWELMSELDRYKRAHAETGRTLERAEEELQHNNTTHAHYQHTHCQHNTYN